MVRCVNRNLSGVSLIFFASLIHAFDKLLFLGKPDVVRQLEVSLADYSTKYAGLEMLERNAVKTALLEERSHFCFLVRCLKPVMVRCLILLFVYNLCIFFIKYFVCTSVACPCSLRLYSLGLVVLEPLKSY